MFGTLRRCTPNTVVPAALHELRVPSAMLRISNLITHFLPRYILIRHLIVVTQNSYSPIFCSSPPLPPLLKLSPRSTPALPAGSLVPRCRWAAMVLGASWAALVPSLGLAGGLSRHTGPAARPQPQACATRGKDKSWTKCSLGAKIKRPQLLI